MLQLWKDNNERKLDYGDKVISKCLNSYLNKLQMVGYITVKRSRKKITKIIAK